MIKKAFLFPGQGSQYIGMGKKLYDKYDIAKETFKEADETLGFDLSNLMFNGKIEDLTKTSNAQPAILTLSIAMFRVLSHKKIFPDILAGHSLGEISALCAADSISFKDALLLSRKRGELMQEAIPLGQGAMAAINSRDIDMIDDICKKTEKEIGKCVGISNYNSHTQQVISGDKEAVIKVAEKLDIEGIKAKLLNVSGPFHSKLMEPCAKEFEEVIKDYEFIDPKYTVIANVDAKAYKNSLEIKDKLIRQIYSPVKRTDSMTYLKKAMVAYCIEIGPQEVLKNLMKTNVSDLATFSFDVEEDKIYSYIEKSYYPFISRAMGIAVATKNNNFDGLEYEKGVVKSYEKMQGLQLLIENEKRMATKDEMNRALDLLITIFDTKGTDKKEQEERIKELFSDSGQQELFIDFSLET